MPSAESDKRRRLLSRMPRASNTRRGTARLDAKPDVVSALPQAIGRRSDGKNRDYVYGFVKARECLPMTVAREQLDAMSQGRLGWTSRPDHTSCTSYRKDGEAAVLAYLLLRSTRLRLLQNAGRDTSRFLDAASLRRRENSRLTPMESERSHAPRC